jgi:hypothetical protein
MGEQDQRARLCRKHRATLVIAKLDRLARTVHLSKDSWSVVSISFA